MVTGVKAINILILFWFYLKEGWIASCQGALEKDRIGLEFCSLAL